MNIPDRPNAISPAPNVHADVVENIRLRRFELPITGEIMAAAYYQVESGKVMLVHTEVPSEFSGQGVASRLAQGTFALLRKTGRKAILRCPFMSWFFERHPDYADVVDKQLQERSSMLEQGPRDDVHSIF